VAAADGRRRPRPNARFSARLAGVVGRLVIVSSQREQRLVFGEVAEQYDAFRPSYPDEAFDTIIEYGHLCPGDRALEIGAGTGKATVKMAARGLEITALEPSPEMAAVLRSKGIEPIETTFESWRLERAAFPLVYAAQAWHWVHGADRYERVASALVPGGVVALFWNQGGEWDGPLGAAIDAVYERHAPHLNRVVRQWNMDVLLEQLSATPAFAPAEKRTVTWSQSYTRAEWESLLGTHSDHRILPEEQRHRLHSALGDVIDLHGGRVDVSYDVNIYLARRE